MGHAAWSYALNIGISSATGGRYTTIAVSQIGWFCSPPIARNNAATTTIALLLVPIRLPPLKTALVNCRYCCLAAANSALNVVHPVSLGLPVASAHEAIVLHVVRELVLPSLGSERGE